MQTTLDRIELFRMGGNVSRFHTKPLIKPQDNAQHSYNCAMIAHELAGYFDINEVDPYNVVMAMLVHDVPEQAIGDSPHDTKNYNPGIKAELEIAEQKWFDEKLPEYRRFQYDLNENEDYVCKLSDQLEAMFKSIEELDMGNKTMVACVRYIYLHIVNKMRHPNPNHMFNLEFGQMMDNIHAYLIGAHNIHV